MAKKNLKSAAANVFDQIATGAENAENTNATLYVQDDEPRTGRTRLRGTGTEWVRLNLRIPADVKEYLAIAAARQTIADRKPISLTEYMCNRIYADMEKHKDD